MTTNYERAFAARPEVLAAWGELLTAIKAGVDERRYELAPELRQVLVVGRPIAEA